MRALTTILVVAASVPMQAEIVDSVVAVVDGRPIKHSDVIREIRLAAFMNHEDASFSPSVKKEAVKRLIDQVFIRQEIIATSAPVPSAIDNLKRADTLLQQLRTSYGSDPDFRQKLMSYGITEQELRQQLEWQVAVLQFVELRFGRIQNPGAGSANTVNDEFFAWLDSMREQKRVEIREERLQ